ncbi:MAG: MarC family protein [Pirellulales bacterium]|nr:MarC family protein [Pirellulales bacterium]
MHEYLLHAGTVFMGFFAIMNPVANTPVFLGLTAEDDEATRRLVARNAIALTFVIIVVFCAAGRLIFELFGISLAAFRVTGGLLVFLIGYHMLQGEQSSVHAPSEADRDDAREAELSVAISPLAMPILGGPGTIATAMNFASKGGVEMIAITVAAFFVLCVITYFFFVSGERLVRYIGKSAINAITRMMGLILAVIGTQMVIDGVKDVVNSF